MFGDTEKDWYSPWRGLIKPLPKCTDFLYSNPIFTNPIYANFIHTIPIYANPINTSFTRNDSMYKNFNYYEPKYFSLCVKAIWDKYDPIFTDPVETKPTYSPPVYANSMLCKHPMNTVSINTTQILITAMRARAGQPTRTNTKPAIVRSIPCVHLDPPEEHFVVPQKNSRWRCPNEVQILRINTFIRRMEYPMVYGYNDRIDDYQQALIRTINFHFDDRGNILTNEQLAKEALLVRVGPNESPYEISEGATQERNVAI